MTEKDKISIALLKENQVRNDKDHEFIKTNMSNFEEKVDQKFDELNKKLDKALECKADKAIVDEKIKENKDEIKILKNWMLYSVIGGIIIFTVLQGLDYIRGLIK